MTDDEQISALKNRYDKINDGLPINKMAIRENIILEILDSDYPKFGFEFFAWRSPEMATEMDMFIKYAVGKKCFIDCGAFHGVFSLVFSEINKNGFVHAFEPYYKPYQVLQSVCKKRDKIAINMAALSDYSGQFEMYEYDGHLEWKRRNGIEQSPIYAHCITGDAYCFGINPNIAPDIIKIDCEGQEVKVLTGFQNVIARFHPVIFLEIHKNFLTPAELVELMGIIGHFKYKVIDVGNGCEINIVGINESTKTELRVLLL